MGKEERRYACTLREREIIKWSGSEKSSARTSGRPPRRNGNPADGEREHGGSVRREHTLYARSGGNDNNGHGNNNNNNNNMAVTERRSAAAVAVVRAAYNIKKKKKN